MLHLTKKYLKNNKYDLMIEGIDEYQYSKLKQRMENECKNNVICGYGASPSTISDRLLEREQNKKPIKNADILYEKNKGVLVVITSYGLKIYREPTLEFYHEIEKNKKMIDCLLEEIKHSDKNSFNQMMGW